MQTKYRPGNWHLLVRPGTIVALPPDAAEAVVAALWDESAHGSLTGLITALADGGSFLDLPSFVAAVVEGDAVRVAARGSVTIRVTSRSGADETVSGADVSTWSERFVANATRIELTVEQSESRDSLPIGSGIVFAGAAGAELQASDVATPEVRMAPETEPPAAPTEPDAESTGPDADASVPSLEEHLADGAPITEVPTPLPTDGVDGSTLLPTEMTYAPAVEEQEWDETQRAPVDATVVRPEPEKIPEQPLAGSVPPPPPSAIVTPPAPNSYAEFGDHDGATISVAEARALRGAAAADETPTAIIPQQSTTGRIRMSTGQTVTLDRTVIIGRRPRSTRASGSTMPHLIAVESPQQDISRNHLEVRPEGDSVVVIDLNTTNGSMLHRPGTDPVRLHPSEQTLVLDGDLIDLGDGVTLTFEGLA